MWIKGFIAEKWDVELSLWEEELSCELLLMNLWRNMMEEEPLHMCEAVQPEQLFLREMRLRPEKFQSFSEAWLCNFSHIPTSYSLNFSNITPLYFSPRVIYPYIYHFLTLLNYHFIPILSIPLCIFYYYILLLSL